MCQTLNNIIYIKQNFTYKMKINTRAVARINL